MHPAADNIQLLEHRNAAITLLYQSKDFNDCINKMEPDHLREDLKQEVILILMEKDPALIVAMDQRGELRWYVVRTILNMVCSNSSPFTKKYRKYINDYVAQIDGGLVEFVSNEGTELNDRQYRFSKKINDGLIYKNGAELPGRLRRECQSDAVMNYINHELYWYDRAIIMLYMKHGSYRKIEEETRIPWESCYSTVRKCIAKIRKEVLDVAE